MAGRVTHRAARSGPAHGAASGTVDNPTFAKPHLTNSNSCPTKRGHLYRPEWPVRNIRQEVLLVQNWLTNAGYA